jgi:hypothetical protein
MRSRFDLPHQHRHRRRTLHCLYLPMMRYHRHSLDLLCLNQPYLLNYHYRLDQNRHD